MYTGGVGKYPKLNSKEVLRGHITENWLEYLKYYVTEENMRD